MDLLTMSAFEDVRNWASRLPRKQLECRVWRHQMTRPNPRTAEPTSDGGIRYYRKCRECGLPMIYTYYPRTGEYTLRYCYDDPRFKDYTRKGKGPLEPDQRTVIREMVMGL